MQCPIDKSVYINFSNDTSNSLWQIQSGNKFYTLKKKKKRKLELTVPYNNHVLKEKSASKNNGMPDLQLLLQVLIRKFDN